jgi:hypothetical protein
MYGNFSTVFPCLRPRRPALCRHYLCSPNAVHYTLRDCMVVRSCAEIAAGEEVTINYLGNGA